MDQRTKAQILHSAGYIRQQFLKCQPFNTAVCEIQQVIEQADTAKDEKEIYDIVISCGVPASILKMWFTFKSM